MVVLKLNTWVGYGTEAKYASGQDGATAKGKHAWATGEVVACNVMRAMNWGGVHYEYADEYDAGAGGLQPTATILEGADYQNPLWTDKLAQTAAALHAVSSAAGATPGATGVNYMGTSNASWGIIGSNGLKDVQSFGCVPLHYHLVLEKNRPVLETLEFKHYDSVEAAAGTVTAVAFDSPATYPPVLTKACTVTLDASATRQWEYLDVGVTFVYADPDTDAASLLRDTPVFVRALFTAKVRFRDSTWAGTLTADLKATTLVENHTIVILLPFAAGAGGNHTWTMNNWKITANNDLESLDGEEKLFEVTFAGGTGFTQAVT